MTISTQVMKKQVGGGGNVSFPIFQQGEIAGYVVFTETAFQMFNHWRGPTPEGTAVASMIVGREFRRDGDVFVDEERARQWFGMCDPKLWEIAVECGPYFVGTSITVASGQAVLRSGANSFTILLHVTKALYASKSVMDARDIEPYVKKDLRDRLRSGWVPQNGEEIHIVLT